MLWADRAGRSGVLTMKLNCAALLIIMAAELPFAREKASPMLIFIGVLAIAGSYTGAIPFLVVVDDRRVTAEPQRVEVSTHSIPARCPERRTGDTERAHPRGARHHYQFWPQPPLLSYQ